MSTTKYNTVTQYITKYYYLRPVNGSSASHGPVEDTKRDQTWFIRMTSLLQARSHVTCTKVARRMTSLRHVPYKPPKNQKCQS